MSLGLKKKRPRGHPAETRAKARASEAKGRASSAAGKATWRTQKRSATTTPGARLGQHSEKLGKRVAEVAGRMCMAHAARAKQAASCVIPFSKGDRGDCLGINMPKLPKHAQPVRAFNNVEREFCAWREGQGTRLPSAGRQPTRQTVRVRHEFVPCEFWRAPQTERCPKRLFLSPSAFFEPAKKVRKNCKW